MKAVIYNFKIIFIISHHKNSLTRNDFKSIQIYSVTFPPPTSLIFHFGSKFPLNPVKTSSLAIATHPQPPLWAHDRVISALITPSAPQIECCRRP